MSTTEFFEHSGVPYSNEEIGYFAVPLPPKDVQFGHSAALNVDVGGGNSSSYKMNERQGLSSVIYSDVNGQGGGTCHKVDFSTARQARRVLCVWRALLLYVCT